jgi:hypothetical protein
MRVLQAATFVAAAMLLTGSAATAQSLGEAAAKEKEKRKGKPAPKVITEEELRQAGGTVSSPAAVPDGPAPVAAKPPAGKEGAGAKDGKAAPKEKTPDELRAEQEAAWRERLAAAEKEVAYNKGEVTRLQASLDDTTGGVYTPRRAGLQSSLEQAQRALADSQTKLAGIQEEGRRNSFR